MDNSFAIWHEKRNGESENSNAEIHFNLWQFSSQKNDRIDCLDIGIKIGNISNFSSINLFIPFTLQKNDVRDLGKTITKSTKLLTAIFNEFSTVGSENAKLVEITLSKEGNECLSESFKVYVMDGANNIKLDNCKEGEDNTQQNVGTTISLDTSNISDDVQVPVYLRIRIDLPSQDVLGKILHQHVPKDSWLQSSTAKKQFVDFRLNEKRNLPKTIQETCLGKFLKIEKIHFFLMREFADELIMSDPDGSRYRVLENDIWSEYFSEKPKLKLDHMFAYHWKVSPNEDKEENQINSFTLSTKFSFQESSNWKILIFLLMSLSLGAVGGVAGNFSTDYLKNLGKTTEKSELKSVNSEGQKGLLEKKLRTDDN
jgi:hypothetical protein